VIHAVFFTEEFCVRNKRRRMEERRRMEGNLFHAKFDGKQMYTQNPENTSTHLVLTN